MYVYTSHCLLLKPSCKIQAVPVASLQLHPVALVLFVIQLHNGYDNGTRTSTGAGMYWEMSRPICSAQLVGIYR